MAVHNGQEFLQEAIDSILKQIYQNIELIVVDDASTDSSPEILRNVIDHRLRIITMSSNVGLVDALNLALSQARGGLIARMDADDVAHSERLALQVKKMSSDPSLVLLGTSVEYIDAQGRLLHIETFNTDNMALQRILAEEGNHFCHSSVMMRTEAVRKVMGYRSIAGRYAQDYDLWLRLAEVGTVANLPEPLLRYRVHEGQLSFQKLVPQRRSAEIYKVLARQRRLTGREDYQAAFKEVDTRKRVLRHAVVGDLLRLCDLFARMGRTDRVFFMHMRAFLIAPFSPLIISLMRNCIRRRISSLSTMWH